MKLSDIIEAIQISSDDAKWYYDSAKNELVMALEYKDEYYPSIEDIESYDTFIALPDCYEINEFKMMKKFAMMHLEELFNALHGKGVFRKFKDKVILLGIEEDWYNYRDKQSEKIATQWCDTNNIPLVP